MIVPSSENRNIYFLSINGNNSILLFERKSFLSFKILNRLLCRIFVIQFLISFTLTHFLKECHQLIHQHCKRHHHAHHYRPQLHMRRCVQMRLLLQRRRALHASVVACHHQNREVA